MGLFNFFKKTIVLSAVNKVEKGIKNSNSYKYFVKNDTQMIKEYKDFECSLIASAISVLALNIDLNDINQKKDIQTVYIGKSSSFLRKLISKEYKCDSIELSNKKDLVEQLLILKIHTRFSQYLKDIKKAFKDKSAFSLLEDEESEIKEWSDEKNYIENRAFEFIINLLLAKETLHWDIDSNDYANNDKLCIGYDSVIDLTTKEKELLNSFVSEIELLKLN